MTTLFKLDTKKKIGVLFDNKSNTIKKFYLTPRNKDKELINEFLGFQWYIKKLYKKKLIPNKIILKKKTNSLIFPVFKGTHFKFWDKHIHNTNLIESVIGHYKLLWPQKKIVPYHGDLTIENIIFKKNNNVVFIDWENYRTKEEWGLDICYFLISLIVLPVLNLKRDILKKSELNLFKIYWKKTFKNKNYSYLKNPLNFLRKKCANKNHFLFKISNKLETQIIKSIL